MNLYRVYIAGTDGKAVAVYVYACSRSQAMRIAQQKHPGIKVAHSFSELAA